MEKILEGESTYKGFRIFDKETMVASEYFEEKDISDNPMVLLTKNQMIFNKGLFLISVGLTIQSINTLLFKVWILAIIGFIFMFAGFCNYYKGRKHKSKIKNNIQQASQWHSVEHKIIRLIESGKELTLKNLKAAKKESDCCGVYNFFLEEPDDLKLNAALRVGKEYLRLKGP